MNMLPFEQLMETCDCFQRGLFAYDVEFDSNEDRDLWIHYYGNLVKYYCRIVLHSGVSSIQLHVHDHIAEMGII